MKCPIDDSLLSVSARDGVEIDFCPQCRGVWLDRGELDKIIDRAAAAMPVPPSPAGQPYPPTPEPRYDRPHHEERGRYEDPRKRRRRSFMDDLFDFD